ncbi:thiazolinyl imide reductase [Streptomyces alkaliphilus]|uniref:Thiazolinyl imide reductase n=1 Tax=Streptomyces alkaliphilus TaxID=1472722 RepID=A0A7W3Y1Q5_9ACTN|nr:Gfo/Idh/MocA family oxidoreductase [Streptomyces alkaliphilus]MBB0244929.1 thiazolinyl imide reductase [Streptomyces alkaliphilus]
MSGAPLRVVVAGTSFGRVYLDAVLSAPEHFRLAGVLVRGGDYSRALAERHGVPLFTSVAEVPEEVDIACVVVRSGATGGPGSRIARALLARGIHVLQEHPVHTAEITECVRAAREGGSAYAVNTLHPDLVPVRRFLAAAEVVRRRQGIRFVDAVCNSQVAYPLLDVIGRAVGALRPWSFDEPVRTAGQPFTSLNAVVGGVPVTLRVQNQVHPEDPDNHSYLMHRVALGCEGGVLTLADTHGPVLWNARMHAPRDATGRLVMSGERVDRLKEPSTTVLGPAGTSTFHDVFTGLWPDAVRRSLLRLCEDIARPERRAGSGQWALGVSRAWADLTARLGMPELIRPGEPESLPTAELTAAVEGLEP